MSLNAYFQLWRHHFVSYCSLSVHEIVKWLNQLIMYTNAQRFHCKFASSGAGMPQSVERLATAWMVRGSKLGEGRIFCWEISGFDRCVLGVFALLGCYAALVCCYWRFGMASPSHLKEPSSSRGIPEHVDSILYRGWCGWWSDFNESRSFFSCIHEPNITVTPINNSFMLWHSEDRASWYILITKPTRCTNFSNFFLE